MEKVLACAVQTLACAKSIDDAIEAGAEDVKQVEGVEFLFEFLEVNGLDKQLAIQLVEEGRCDLGAVTWALGELERRKAREKAEAANDDDGGEDGGETSESSESET